MPTSVIKTWLARSGEQPLTLRLSCSYNFVDGNVARELPTLDALLGTAYRWKDLHIRAPSLLLLEHFSPWLWTSHSSLRALEALDVLFTDPKPGASTALTKFFRAMPALHCISLSSYTPDLLTLPWSNMRKLDLKWFQPESIMDMIGQFSSIEELVVTDVVAARRRLYVPRIVLARLS